MTEFIPSPQEKRDGIIRDHTLSLLENLHRRLERIELLGGLPQEESRQCWALIERIADEESQTRAINAQLLPSGKSHQLLRK